MAKTYAEKLLDPRWQKKRLEILSRDKFTCQHCYDTEKTLHVHHKDYLFGKPPWDYPNHFLQTLCCDCHKDVAERMKSLEHSLVHHFRLKMEDSFVAQCTVDVFEKYKDLHGLMYLLWEVLDKQDEVQEFLTTLFQEKTKKSFHYGEEVHGHEQVQEAIL